MSDPVRKQFGQSKGSELAKASALKQGMSILNSNDEY